MGQVQNGAVALQVYLCGCSHCQWLLQHALATGPEIEKFKKYWRKKNE